MDIVEGAGSDAAKGTSVQVRVGSDGVRGTRSLSGDNVASVAPVVLGPGGDDVEQEFEVIEGHDAFAGEYADAMPATDLDACRRRCIEGAFGAFAVRGARKGPGRAFFRSQSAQECRANLISVAEA